MKQKITYPEFKIGDVVVCSEDAPSCLQADYGDDEVCIAVQGVVISAELLEGRWSYCVEAIDPGSSSNYWHGVPGFKLNK
jgi:hypothetical protein